MKLFKTKVIIIIFIISFLFSGSGMAGIFDRLGFKGGGGGSDATLVVYLYQPTLSPKDIRFTIEKVEIQRQDGKWISLSEEPTPIESLEIQGSQALIAESGLKEGKYERLRIWVSNPKTFRDKKKYSLAAPGGEGEFELETTLDIKKGESTAIFLKWDPNRSIKDNFIFYPLVRVEPQKLSPQSLLLYVTNKDSDYVSVIDRFQNRVVAVIGVQEGPTGLALNGEQDRLYVLNSKSGTVSIIDTSQDFVRDRIKLVSGLDPTEMAIVKSISVASNGKLYITNQGTNDVSVIDIGFKSQTTRIKVENEPLGITVNQERSEVYVANSGSGSISIIDAFTDTVKNTINIGSKPLDVVVVDDFLYVLSDRANRITVIDVISGKITSTIPSGISPRKGIYSKQFDRVYLSHYNLGQLSFLIPSMSLITRSIDLGIKPRALAIDESRNRLYITGYDSNKLAVINPVSETIESTITVGKGPYEVIFIK